MDGLVHDKKERSEQKETGRQSTQVKKKKRKRKEEQK